MAAGGDPYNGEIAWMDRQLGRLVYHVRKLGRLRRTIWVVVADHGEALGDHGEATHGKLLHDVTVRVPLFISVPGQRKQSRYSEQVSLLDVAPTLCELAGLPVPRLMRGQSLMPLLQGEPWPGEPIVMLEAPRPGGEAGRGLLGMRFNRFKIVGNARTVTVFDLVKDPDELQGSTPDGEEATKLRKHIQLLLDMRQELGEESLAPIGPGDREKLQALGYMD
jgi:arylsulfatase A-like enzyme